MQLSLTEVVKSYVSSTSPPEKPLQFLVEEDHSYVRGHIENRGPCPGLNSLANHGYLPRDGKNITVPHVKHALKTALKTSDREARALTSSLRPLLKEDGTFDLPDTRKHNLIEHDASFTRLDLKQGDNFTFQPKLFQAMVDDAQGGPITHQSLARTYIRRERESRDGGAPRLPLKMWIARIFEAVAALNTARMDGGLPIDVATVLYTEERFPDVMLNNPKPDSTLHLLRNALVMIFWVILMRLGLVDSGLR